MPDIFSPIQHTLLKILGNKTMKVTELAEKVYADAVPKPLSPANALNSAITYINYKCEMHEFKWKLQKEGMGRNGATIKKVVVESWDV